MIKAIVFDLDGTLLNTAPDIRRVLNASLKKFGFPPVSEDRLYMMVGDGAHKLIERAVPSYGRGLTEEVYRDYIPAFAACDNANTTLYPWEAEVLSRLKAAGIKMCVLSNKPQAAAENVCADKLGEYGLDIVIGQGRFPLKPDPAGVEHIMRELNVHREECIIVGDGETDILTAKNAGLPCISVLWGFRTREQLERSGGELFAENYARFLQILQEKFLLNA